MLKRECVFLRREGEQVGLEANGAERKEGSSGGVCSGAVRVAGPVAAVQHCSAVLCLEEHSLQALVWQCVSG